MTDDVCTCRTIALSGWDTVQQVVDPTCPLHATYTAAEVKVLTEAALRLGRKEALEEAAETLQGYAADPYDVHGDAANGAFLMAAGVVRGMAKGHMHPPYGSEGVSDATSVPSEGPGTSEPSKAAKTPQERCGCLLGPIHTKADHRDIAKEPS